ncbi:kinase-like domain-containing protein [Trichoderma barbatum]
MAGEISDAQSAHHPEIVNFAVFSAANTAAIHLLDTIQSELSPPNLKRHGNTIGYQLLIPLSPSKHDSKEIWRIGAGPPAAIIERKLDHVKPDILLCPPEGSLSATIARQFIKDIHASMRIHPKSDVLMLKTTSSRPVVYEHGDRNQQDLELRMPNNTCVMRRSRNFLRFGDYRFALEFVVRGQDKDEIKVRSTGYRGLHPSPALNPGPMAYSKTSWNIWLHNRIPETSITSGVDIYTGEPVAVKQLQNKMARLPYTRNRLQVARLYHNRHDKGVLGVIDVWCEHNISPPCSSNGLRKTHRGSCEQTFYSMPLAKNNFLDVSWLDIEFENRLALFYQTLTGLAELHQQEIAHGNISPKSLLILAEAEPVSLARRAVVSVNMHKRKKEPEASVCVAPEIWETKSDGDLDETKLDIWALAVSWLFAFTVPPKNLKMTKQTYGGIKTTLDTQTKKGFIKEPLNKLLRKMLAWEPQDRPNATEALKDEVWKPIREERQGKEDFRKRRRQEKMQTLDSGVKRVRVLSPDPEE